MVSDRSNPVPRPIPERRFERKADAEVEEPVYSEPLSTFRRIDGGAVEEEELDVMVDVRRAGGMPESLPMGEMSELLTRGRTVLGETGEPEDVGMNLSGSFELDLSLSESEW
jgi:hypothetical protein